MSVDKPYNGGTWSEARMKAFIKGGLRALTRKWGPIHQTRKDARLDRGVYKCAGYKRYSHQIRNKDGIAVDHIDPIIPLGGFVSWDNVVERMFVEKDKLQLLCKECHDKKTKEERREHAQYKLRGK